MVRKFASISFAGALLFAAAPAFAQGVQLPLVGNIDLDPFHIMTPAPAPMMHKRMMMHHKHMMVHHHGMMMHHKKMMMKKM